MLEALPLASLVFEAVFNSLSCISKLPLLDNSIYLKSKSSSNERINYLLVSENFQILKNILSQVENDKKIIEYQLNEE